MAHHHLLPLILALILVILPSSSHAQTPALFSDKNVFLTGGNDLTDGIYTLSLANDCSLVYYGKDNLTKDYNTTIKEAKFCQLSINRRGRLMLETGDDDQNPRFLGPAYVKGDYALLFTNKGLSVYGPRIWYNGVPRPRRELQNLKNKNLRATTSSNVLYSPEIKNGTESNGPIATNKDVSVYITPYCALSVNNTKKGENIWNSNSTSAEPRDCSLYLTERGVLTLISKDSKGLHTQWTGGDLQKLNDYVVNLRDFGGVGIYGFAINVGDIHPYPGSVAENIKMVTTAA